MKFFVILALSIGLAAHAEVKVDAAAPNFSEKSADGKTYSLKDLKGKWVVLEWFNKDCPYVKKHYRSGNMQNLQRQFTEKGVTWLTVLSSAEGKQGYLKPTDALTEFKSSDAKTSAILIDADGSMGKAYDAKTTPHMFVINPEGNVVYAGAIDSNDSADPKTIGKAENYVKSALEAGMSNPPKPIAVKTKTPYGCSIKYN